MTAPAFTIPGFGDLEPIGSGGFSRVFKAVQVGVGRTVAVKVLFGTVHDDGSRGRFEREASAAGRLSDHPHVVPLHASGVTDDGHPYLVLDYLPGGSLGERLRQYGPLPVAEVVNIGAKLAGALETAHRAGILHRDVKPDNVLMSRYGEPQLTDFGIASVVGGYETRSGVLSLSLGHAPPEVIGATPGFRPKATSDIYSLGSSLFNLLTGELPFPQRDGEMLPALLARIVTEPVPDLRARGVPDPVARVIETAMAKDPAVRYQRVVDLGSALVEAGLLSGFTVTPPLVEAVAADPFAPSGGAPVVSGPRPVSGPTPIVPVTDPGPADPVPATSERTVVGPGGLATGPTTGLATVSATGPTTGTAPAPAVVTAPAARPPRRRRVVLLLAVLALVIGGGAAAVAVSGDGGDPPGVAEEPTSDPPTDTTEPDPATTTTVEALGQGDGRLTDPEITVEGPVFAGEPALLSLDAVNGDDSEVSWELGDGLRAEGMSVSATFAEPGEREVVVTVGTLGTVTQTITVHQRPQAAFTVTGGVTSEATTLIPTGLVTFQNASTGSADGVVYEWLVDGATIAEVEHLQHAFTSAEPLEHTVTLRMRNDTLDARYGTSGAFSSEATVSVTVFPGLPAPPSTPGTTTTRPPSGSGTTAPPSGPGTTAPPSVTEPPPTEPPTTPPPTAPPPVLVSVPNVVGMSLSQASSTIRGSRLEVGSVSNTTSCNGLAGGQVVSQSPGAGSQLEQYLGTVSLVVCLA